MRGSPFRAWLEERVLVADDDWLVVDKPSGFVPRAVDARDACDVVSRLQAHLTSAGRNPYLGACPRLHAASSGVLPFVRRPELDADVSSELATGKLRERYLAAIEIGSRSSLARQQTLSLEHRLQGVGESLRVARSGGSLHRTSCKVLERRGTRAIVELAPRTGGALELCAQLAGSDAPVAGDRARGGAFMPRVLMHRHSVELAGRRFASPMPALMRQWLAGDATALGAGDELARRVRDAACRRYPLLASTQALRWINGEGDELAGVVVDWYAGYATLSTSSDEAFERREELAARLHEEGAEGVYLKVRARVDLRRVNHIELAPPLPVAGQAAAERLEVREPALRAWVFLGDGLSSGLFLDQRDNRQRVRQVAAGTRVLNLFSYTCSFSVAAALGGATHVTSVDLSKRALRRGERNFALNGLDPQQHAFVQLDALRFLERGRTRRERFDLVVLDPPSFSSAGGGKVLRVDRDYLRLARLSLAVCADAGRLLAVTNHRGTSLSALRKTLLEAARLEGKAVAAVEELPSGLDCPEGQSGPEPSKSVLLTLR